MALSFSSVRARRLPWALAAALLPALGAGPLHGQGFGVYEQGTCAMARAGAAAAEPCADGSAVFFNPGALGADLEEGALTLTAGGTLIAVTGGFTADRTGEETDLDADPAVAPHAFVRYGVTDRLAAGIGIYVPYGLGTEWPEDFQGAFTGFDNSLESVYIQPTASYRWEELDLLGLLLEEVALGGGPALVVGGVEINQMLDLSEQPIPEELAEAAGLPAGTTFEEVGIPRNTAFARARLEASRAVGLGGHLGLQVRAREWLSFGARFLSPVTLSYGGDATFEPVETGLQVPEDNPFGLPGGTPVDALMEPAFGEGAPLRSQDVETELTMPAQVVAGVSAEVMEGLRLHGDYQWTRWSSFDRVELDFEEDALDEVLVQNYENTHGVRAGGELELTEEWTLGAGYIFNTSAAPPETVTPLLPEAQRNHGTLGVGWQATERWRVHAAYHLLEQNDRRGRTRGPRVGTQPDVILNDGLYTFRAHLVGLTLTVELP